jgi:hypothetical protein
MKQVILAVDPARGPAQVHPVCSCRRISPALRAPLYLRAASRTAVPPWQRSRGLQTACRGNAAALQLASRRCTRRGVVAEWLRVLVVLALQQFVRLHSGR